MTLGRQMSLEDCSFQQDIAWYLALVIVGRRSVVLVGQSE